MRETKKIFKINLTLLFVIFFNFQIFPNISNGVEPEEMLADKKMELEARIISKNIRCLVCQNQSIDESNAPLAKDLRILIRDELREGKSEEEIYKYLTDRYGDFILLKPAFNLSNILLWLLPLFFLILGLFIIWNKSRNFRNT